MSTFLGIVETLGIILSLALILATAILSQVRLSHPRWRALKKVAQAGVAGLLSGLIVAFIASIILSFILTYVGSHAAHDGYASCLNDVGNNVCTAPTWDSATFDIYIIGAILGAGVGIARYQLQTHALQSTSIPPRRKH